LKTNVDYYKSQSLDRDISYSELMINFKKLKEEKESLQEKIKELERKMTIVLSNRYQKK